MAHIRLQSCKKSLRILNPSCLRIPNGFLHTSFKQVYEEVVYPRRLKCARTLGFDVFVADGRFWSRL